MRQVSLLMWLQRMRPINWGEDVLVVCASTLVSAGVARAGVAWNPPGTVTGAAELLKTGDAALDAGERGAAQAAYQRVVTEFPASAEAVQARRLLQALALPATMPPGAEPATPPPSAYKLAPPNRDVVIRNEPYSLRTSERLRQTAWEKLDFGVTAFIYGASLGVSLGIATRSNDAGPVVLGALSYTGASVSFLSAANPDRCDLPQALG